MPLLPPKGEYALEQIRAPWSPDQVDALNRYQRQGNFHPFTCGGNRADKAHRDWAMKNGDRYQGLLVATAKGWVCPVCGYTQDWAHAFMAGSAAGFLTELPEESPLDRALRLASERKTP